MGRFAHLGAYGFEGARDVEVARNAMRATEVEHLRARSILELSGGETQRVIIARALAQEARILLLDEPTAFLDIKHQVEITSLVKNLQAENGLTVISISHDLNLAAAFSQSLLLLKEGSVFASGSPDEVIREEVLSEAYDTSVRVRHLDEGRIVAPRFKV